MKITNSTVKTMRYLSLLLTLALCGCWVNPPVEGRNDPYEAKQIHFEKDELRRDTAVGRPRITRDDSNLLYVTVPIRSAYDRVIYVDYRVTFFDSNGEVINKTTWFSKTLEANTPDQISVNSTSPRAVDFQVDFRYSR
jgi:hypothetical protein